MLSSVLIVDDEPGITAALYLRLQAAGYTVFHAINGLAGIEAAQIHRPDVIIMDIRMPDVDGVDVCRLLKCNPALAHIPVIFLSANTQEAARRRAIAAGGTAFMPKPYETSDLIDAIERVTSEAHQPQQNLRVAPPLSR